MDVLGMGETLLRTSKFEVQRRDFSVDGRRLHREIVVHPGAVVVLPVLEMRHHVPQSRIVTICHYRYAVGEELLELPAGTLEPPEPPEVCARRELQEETGYRAAKVQPFGYFYPSPGIMTEKMYGFVATELSPGPQRLEQSERISVRVMTLAEVLAAIRRGQVHDAKTIAAILLFHLRGGDGGES